jgi:SNF2 family DNA or RNA helicase
MMKMARKDLKQHRFSALVLDEAQRVKNTLTENFSVAGQITTEHRLYLTGTTFGTLTFADQTIADETI